MPTIPSISLEELARLMSVNPLLRCAELARLGGPGGSLIRDFVISTSPVKVPHRLRAIPLGFLPTKRDKAAVIFAPPGPDHAWTKDYIVLQSDLADTTIRGIVY
jgi:hypothetical protein